ncbi:MAG: methyltransferase [Pseudomonadota bacterium]
MFRPLSVLSTCALISACGQSAPEQSMSAEAPEPMPVEVIEEIVAPEPASLDDIISALPEEAQARVVYRNPKETLEFFGVEPGMTVVDTTPGSIWYTGILAAYLGPEGKVIGADRPLSVWESFGSEYSPPEFLAERPNWTTTWPEEKAATYDADAPSFDAIAYGAVPAELAGTVDVVMMIREFHNIMAADDSNALIEDVLAEIYMLLKPGGVFGMVQHRAQEEMPDAWADGSRGYIKQSTVVALAEGAGFTLEATSDVNTNPKDQPTEDDAVWRLAPTLDVPEEDTELLADMVAIGESDRMTLKFRKAE